MAQTLRVADVMSENFVSVKADMDLSHALQTLLTRNTPVALVVNDDQELIGVFSENDCLKSIINTSYHNNHVISGKVSDLMTRDIKTVPPDMDIFSLASLFVSHSFRRFPVVEEGKLLGQVSRQDMLRAVKKLLIDEKKVSNNPVKQNPKDTRRMTIAVSKPQEE